VQHDAKVADRPQAGGVPGPWVPKLSVTVIVNVEVMFDVATVAGTVIVTGID
jgi:hypothetical protein